MHFNPPKTLAKTVLNLQDFAPKYHFETFDLTPFLYKGMILLEKEFMSELEQVNWSVYKGKVVSISIHPDVVIPQWAYLYIAQKLKNYAVHVSTETLESLRIKFWEGQLRSADFSRFQGREVVLNYTREVPQPVFAIAVEILTDIVERVVVVERGIAQTIYQNTA